MIHLNLRLIVFSFFLIQIFEIRAGVIDTLYYDKNWKGVESAFDAEYIRIISIPDDTRMPKSFKDYYSSGELQCKGYFISIDKYDDDNSVFDGEIESYYKSGSLMSKVVFKDGVKIGSSFQYSENGSLRVQYIYENGKSLDYYVLYSGDDCYGKYDIRTSRPIISPPQPSDIKQNTYGSLKFSTYLINGIKLSCSEEDVKDYGKYHRFHFVITNMTNTPLDISLKDISVYSIKKNKQLSLKIYNVEEYLKKIDNKTKLAKWYHNTNERMNAQQAGNITVNVKEDSYYNSTTNTNANASAYGSTGTSAYGYGTSTSTTYGNTNTTKQVTIRDEAAAYEAQQRATQNINDYNENLENQKKVRANSYLKEGILNKFETASGYINVDKSDGETLNLYIVLDNIKYPFSFSVSDH